MWLNVTKNTTVYGNWTRTVTKSVQIKGLGQPIDSVISPDGQYFYVCTGYFQISSTYGASGCSDSSGCAQEKGHLTYFKRDPSDGSLFWAGTQRYPSLGFTHHCLIG